LPSIWLKIPVVIAWSTPGAALLVISLQGVPLPQAIGAFIVNVLMSASLQLLWGMINAL
jgi:benzoate membrane transport protein